jgi:phage repressor protein C with HTH and peptisase S24 domain
MEKPDARKTLQSLVAERGVSLAALSGLLGRNPAYLQQFVRKGSPRKLEENDRKVLARFFGVDESILSGGGRELEEKSYAEIIVSKRPARSEYVDVPRLAFSAAAGAGALAASEQPFGALRFSQSWLREMGLHGADLATMTVAGDSMEPTLRDGDEILVDRSVRALRDGVHVVRVEDSLLVKRVDMGRPGRVRLCSDNTHYAPIDMAPNEVIVIGRVVWKGGRL